MAADVSGMEVISNMFEGLEFCVISGSNVQSKAELEKLIYQFGGKFVQNPIAASTFCVIASKTTLKVDNLIQHGNFGNLVHL